ncbi:hypothetical protein JCM17961_35920 [Endothiovibrio diazotrophicus]
MWPLVALDTVASRWVPFSPVTGGYPNFSVEITCGGWDGTGRDSGTVPARDRGRRRPSSGAGGEGYGAVTVMCPERGSGAMWSPLS